LRQELDTDLTISQRGDGLLMAHYGRVCIALWTKKPTLGLFELQRTGLASAALRRPGQQLFVCVSAAKADSWLGGYTQRRAARSAGRARSDQLA
jgi:hypothetical protein